MRAVYDQVAQTVYIYVNGGKVVFSDEVVPDLAWADYDKNDSLVGVEIVGVDEFSFSLDYPDERHNEFRKLKKNFEHLRELIPRLAAYGNRDIVLACVIQSENYRDLPRIAELAKQWGVEVNFSIYNHLRTGNRELSINSAGALDELRTIFDHK